MNLFIYPVPLSWMNKEALPDCAQPWEADRRGREPAALWSQKGGTRSPGECWAGLNDHYGDTHRHGRADTHMLHVCIGEQMGCTNTPTHTRMHAPPPPLPGVLIWHSIYTHIYSVYSLLYEADRYLSATLLWGARASWRCNQTVHSLRALSHCSFNNGLWEMHKEWAACSREGGQAGRQAPGSRHL